MEQLIIMTVSEFRAMFEETAETIAMKAVAKYLTSQKPRDELIDTQQAMELAHYKDHGCFRAFLKRNRISGSKRGQKKWYSKLEIQNGK